jgi:hypothetical protein
MRHLLLACILSAASAAASAAPPATPATELQALQATIARLNARVDRLERTGPALIPGSYRIHGLQTELAGEVGFARVSSYVYEGTVTFNADGTYRTKGSSTGSHLKWGMCCLPGTAVREIKDDDPEKGRGRWTLEGNRLTLKSENGSFVYSGAGDMFVGASSNTLDGTSVMLMFVREQP